MIRLSLVRIGYCELCLTEFYMPADGSPVSECPGCGSRDWMYGKESLSSIRARMGLTFATRKLDGRRDRRKVEGSGAKSLKRRERARRQYQALKPKPERLDGQSG